MIHAARISVNEAVGSARHDAQENDGSGGRDPGPAGARRQGAFGTIGFAAAKASDIAQRAGVTRGALLHHFGDKEGLFAAVLEEVEAESATHVLEVAITGSDPLEWLRRGFEAFLVECVKPDITQIMLIDGPSVLGWEAWHEIDARYGYRPLLDVVEPPWPPGLVESDDPAPSPTSSSAP